MILRIAREKVGHRQGPSRQTLDLERGRAFSRIQENRMAERKRVRRNTLERRCLPKSFKRLFLGAPKGIFKMLEAIKKN